MRQTGLSAWHGGLLATSTLALVFFAALFSWRQGHTEWAFILAFAGVWSLVSVILSAVRFTEQSGLVLARIVDENFENLHQRISELEEEVSSLRREGAVTSRKAS